MTIFIASPSIDVCRRGASKSSKFGPVKAAMGGGTGFSCVAGSAPRSRSAAISGLEREKVKENESIW